MEGGAVLKGKKKMERDKGKEYDPIQKAYTFLYLENFSIVDDIFLREVPCQGLLKSATKIHVLQVLST